MLLSRHLRRFRTILRRSKTLSEQDKQIVEGKMHSFDSLLESDPEFQQKMAEWVQFLFVREYEKRV